MSLSLPSAVARGLRDVRDRVQALWPSAYRVFDVRLARREPLSPSLERLVFTGEDLARMRTLAPDQRIKLVLPGDDGTPPALPRRGDWHAALQRLPGASRPALRTYTIRRLRRAQRELDVDFVLHGATGPASRWAMQAQPGARAQIVAPDAAYPADPGGYEWKPPKDLREVLLIGDETALPAIAGILEQLRERALPPLVHACIEVPVAADCLPLAAPAGTTLHWMARDTLGLAHGEGMLRAAREFGMPAQARRARAPQALSEVDIDREFLWDAASADDGAFYAWIAGESAAVMKIRRHFVGTLGYDRSAFNLMGYWRLGKVLS